MNHSLRRLRRAPSGAPTRLPRSETSELRLAFESWPSITSRCGQPPSGSRERLARPAYTVDLGRVEVFLGPDRLKIVRRKVLGLLCFLSSRPTMAATRDEVLEALWPDLAPDTAGNSLHQTIYFLRRVFEPDYREGLSAGYVTYDGELVALSEALCDSLSRRCWRAIRRIPADAGVPGRTARALQRPVCAWTSPTKTGLATTATTCTRPFSAPPRLGSSGDFSLGDFEAAIKAGHRILAVDPDADGIELLLLRAYKARRSTCGCCRAIRPLRGCPARPTWREPAAAGRDLGSVPRCTTRTGLPRGHR